MGIHDRDYYREATRQSGWITGTAPVVRGLIVVNTLVFVLQILTSRSAQGVTEWLYLDSSLVLERFQIWRLVTAAFCHEVRLGESLPWQLLFNLLFLYWFGRVPEALYGSREFACFYFLAVLASTLLYLALSAVLYPLEPLVGASAPVMAVVVLHACYSPHDRILLFFLFPIEVRWLAVGYAILNLYPLLLALGGVMDLSRPVHACNLAGLLYGYLYKRFDLRLGRLPWGRRPFRLSRLLRRRPRLKLYHPTEAPDVDRRVDEILAKIHSDGEASLSDEERQVLLDASRRYRQR